VLDLIHTDPRTVGEDRSRWTLAGLGRHCLWLGPITIAGRCQVLDRLGISLKRARAYIHSPDPCYSEKVSRVQVLLRQCVDPGDESAILFLDQMGYYRQPVVGREWEEKGHRQALARRSHGADYACRIVAALDPFSGRVLYWQGPHVDIPHLVTFYEHIVHTYAGARTIYLAADNWPVHVHPDVLAALVPQSFPVSGYPPKTWPTQPSTQARRLNLPIQMVFLPTYAPWTNPIEKLWRWLKQDVIYLHRCADHFAELQIQVASFLDQFREGSRQLLRYVGLTPNSRLYGNTMKLVPQPP
jgi:hypothetical protein